MYIVLVDSEKMFNICVFLQNKPFEVSSSLALCNVTIGQGGFLNVV